MPIGLLNSLYIELRFFHILKLYFLKHIFWLYNSKLVILGLFNQRIWTPSISDWNHHHSFILWILSYLKLGLVLLWYSLELLLYSLSMAFIFGMVKLSDYWQLFLLRWWFFIWIHFTLRFHSVESVILMLGLECVKFLVQIVWLHHDIFLRTWILKWKWYFNLILRLKF